MKRLLTFFAVIGSALVLSSYDTANMPVNEASASKVYICTGGSSKKYHSSASCSGLRNCSGEVKAISKADAEKMGRTPCKICYK